MVRLGVFGARGDERGLARQSQGFCKHLQPARVFGIDMTADDLSPYPVDWSHYDDMNLTVRPYSSLDADEIYRWLKGLDVVIGAETFYRDEFYDIAKRADVRTVLQINPEFSAWWTIGKDDPRPDVFINPTIWRMNFMADVHHLPFPVDREVFPFRQRTEAKRFVHVAGHAAMGDRAGTRLCLSLLPRSRGKLDFEFIIRSQSPLQWTGRGYVTSIEQKNVADPRDLYADADVIVLPRRYGGQCLTVNEALSCFPANTPVAAKGVQRTFERQFTGSLIRAHVENGGVLEMTPEHPVWTEKGWKTGRELQVGLHLLYTRHDDTQSENVFFQGRIGAASRAFPNDVGRRTSTEDGVPSESLIAPLLYKVGIEENGRRRVETSSHQSSVRNLGLLSRDYRRRRHYLDSHVQPSEKAVEAAYQGLEHFNGIDRLDKGDFAPSFGLHHRSSETAPPPAKQNHHNSGIFTLTLLRRSLSIPADKKEALRVDGGVLQDPSLAAEVEAREQATVRNHLSDSYSQYQRITRIEVVAVRELPVYNLGTSSGTYLAKGFLVHNCGCPVIMLNREPENTWPGVIPVSARRRGRLRTKGGHIDMYDSNGMHLWLAMKELMEHPNLVEQRSYEAGNYAQSISWETLLPVYQDFLRAVKDGDDPGLVLRGKPSTLP